MERCETVGRESAGLPVSLPHLDSHSPSRLVHWEVTSSEPRRGKWVPAMIGSTESSITEEVLVGDDVSGDETEESDGGDDNCDDETLPVETAVGLLVEPAISCVADADDGEPCRHLASSSV